MKWTDLYPLARGGDAEQLLMDSGLHALQRSRDPRLHAEVSAAVPTVPRLCHVLDAYGVAVPYDVEWRLVTSYRLA